MLVRAQVLVLVGYAAAATLLSGCYPVTTLQSPRTQAPRAVELTLAAPRVGFTRSDQGGPPIDRLQYIPAPDVSMRIGVAEGWDVGVRGRLCCTIEGSLKHELLRGSTDVAVGLGVITGYDGDFRFDAEYDSPSRETHFTVGRLSLLTGWMIEDAATLWVAPGIHAGHRFGEYTGVGPNKVSYSVPLVAPSLNVGAKIQLGSVASFFAETGLLVPVAGEEIGPFGGAVRLGPRDIHVEATVGFAFAAGTLTPDGRSQKANEIPDPSGR